MADYKKIEEKRKNTWLIKSDRELKIKIDEIRRERIKNGLDEDMSPYNDILKASFRFEPLLDILKKAKFTNDKRGQSSFNIFTFIIVSFIAVVLFAGMIYVMGLINGVFHQVGLQNEVNAGRPGYVNMTQASDDIFGQVNQSIQALRLVALVYILSLAVCIMITNALEKKHPIWFFAYILICLLAVLFSPPISNAYETLLNSGIYDNTLQSFSAPNFILLNLPTVVLIISVFGGIFLFINLIRSPGEGNL